jgi:cyclopropane-fatty-acyl-phospholipid synthase
MKGHGSTADDRAISERQATALPSPSLTALTRLLERIRHGVLELHLPGGMLRRFTGEQQGPRADLTLHNPRVVRRYLTGGSVGFAESYIDGDFDSSDLGELLTLLNSNQHAWTGYYGGLASRLLRRVQHALRPNSRRGAKRNIHAHYDLGNEFFRAWLDPSMLYSSALFSEGARTLHDAQLAKCRALARAIGLQPGQRLLEIGSGWGSFAIMAAKEFGARVTSITISRQQHAHAAQRVQAEGLAEQVEIRLEDYRDTRGSFDRVASIEMFEAVGERYWPVFFTRLRERLTADGIAGLQIITIADRCFESYRKSPDFIQRYVFPGGMLPSPAALEREIAQAGLTGTTVLSFGHDYARTLRLWRERFEDAWRDLAAMGFDERFRRIWRYYLAYCEAGFRTRDIDVVQTVLRPA